MEEKINIAEILKDKPQGTKLYNLLYNIDVELDTIVTTGTKTTVWCTDKIDNNDVCHLFYSEFGTIEGYPDGLQILLPSKEMRDWSKFAWKKGDVLVSNDYGTEVIFYDWYDDTYTNFYGKHYLNSEDKNNIKYNDTFLCTTGRYSLEDRDAAQTYINTIEERLGGKLNRETLEIEKKPEFKNGDIVFVRCDKYNYIEIFNYFKNNGDLYDHASLNIIRQSLDTSGILKILKEGILEIRLATDSEKQQLFDALAKEGKTWNAERKAIVDLKPKVELKPFDKVLCRNSKDDTWEADLFTRLTRKEIDYAQSGKYLCVGDLWMYCIPYNGNESLLGTTKDTED